MLKRLLIAFTVMIMSFVANTTFAESYIRDDILKLSFCNFNDPEMFVRIPCKTIPPCPMLKNPCVSVQPCNSPCEPCNKPKAGWTQGCNCDMDIQKLHEFLAKADCLVGLTSEQKQTANCIRKDAAKEIVELKREIATTESKILGLQNSSSCLSQTNKEIKSLNRDIKRMQNDVKEVCKNAKKDYKRMLNSEQKRIFNNFKKQYDDNLNIVENIPCPCEK